MTTISSICYHYLSRDDVFKRIYGHSFDLLKEHVEYLNRKYTITDAKTVLENNFIEGNRYMLLTFDDGLKEHVKISDYLSSLGIRGVFAIPTCILRNEPPNPQIIHFTAAYFGIRKLYEFIVDEINENFQQYTNKLLDDSRIMDIESILSYIKDLIKRELDFYSLRQLLLNIYDSKLKEKFPNFMNSVHLSKPDIIGLAKNGHTIAVHSDTHPVIKDVENNKELLIKELKKPKQVLSDLISDDVNIFAYPFGAQDDVMEDSDILKEYGYKNITTTFNNNKLFDAMDFGRYCTMSNDTVSDFDKNLWHYEIK